MSKFWERKMRTFFQTFDIDQDGYISEEDDVELARMFAANDNGDSEITEQLIETFVNVWRKLMKSADLEKENRLTINILIKSVKQQLYDPDFMIAFVHLIRVFFKLVDVSHDGFLQAAEFKKILYFQRSSEEEFDRMVVFDALDTDHDEKLSFEEYISGFFDFMFSQDESSMNKYFFGALVD